MEAGIPLSPNYFQKKWLLNSSNLPISEFYQVYAPTPPIGFLMSSPGKLKRVLFWLMLIAGAGAYAAGFYTFLVALGHEPWFLALALASFTAAFGGIAMFIYVVVRLLSNDTR